jgi:hypothetical protein
MAVPWRPSRMLRVRKLSLALSRKVELTREGALSAA